MNTPRTPHRSDGMPNATLAERICELYKDVITSNEPEAAEFANKLFRAYGVAVTLIRRRQTAARKAAKVTIDQGTK